MKVTDLTIEDFRNNRFIPAGIRLLAVHSACVIVLVILIAAVEYIPFIEENQKLEEFVIMNSQVALALAVVFAVIGLRKLITGINGRNRINKFINEVGEDNFMREIYYETLYLYSIDKTPLTIITRRHIIEMNDFIIPIETVAFVRNNRKTRSKHKVFEAYRIDGTGFRFAHKVPYNSPELQWISNALIAANPYILFCNSMEAEIERRRRIEAYRRQF